MRWRIVAVPLVLGLSGCSGDDPVVTERTCDQVSTEASERLDMLIASGKDPQDDEEMRRLTSEVVDLCGRG